MNKHSKSILFVCMGNICRSPAAEGVFKHLIADTDDNELFEVDSAGTIGYHTGNPADPRMQSAAKGRGVSLTSRARKVTPEDLEAFDLVVAMDRDNLADLHSMANANDQSKIKMLGEYLNLDHAPDVPDPYYGGPDGFDLVLDMIESACPAILAHLKQINANSH